MQDSFSFKGKNYRYSIPFKVECDYFDSLSDKEKEFLISFNEVFFNAKRDREACEALEINIFQPDSLNPGKSIIQASDHDKKSARNDIMNVSPDTVVNHHKSRKNKISEIDLLKKYIQNELEIAS